MLLGVQEPSLSSVPDGHREVGELAVQFAEFCGMGLYPWQADLLRDLCITDRPVEISQDELGRPKIIGDYSWASREGVCVVARQNGKSYSIIARELAGIFLFGEKTIFHTAHFMDTAIDAQKNMWEVIESNEELMSWWAGEYEGVPRKTTGNGKESIVFPNGAIVYFRTRTKKTGRGLSVDFLVLDECFDLPHETYAALSKLTRARERAQTLFISSPVNRFEHLHGAVMSAKRWAGIDGEPGVMFKEWSPAEDDDPFSPETWARCNPSLVDSGFGAQLADIESDARTAKNSELLLEQFMVETLARGNWVPRDGEETQEYVLDPEVWGGRFDPSPVPAGDSCVAVDVDPDGQRVAVVAAVKTTTGFHLMLNPLLQFDRPETISVVVSGVEKNDPLGVLLDPKGPSSTLVRGLNDAGVEPTEMSFKSVTAACELFLALFAEGKITHDGDARFVEALKSAVFRTGHGGGRALSKQSGSIEPLVAATFAVWGLVEFAPPEHVDVKRKTRFVGSAKPVVARQRVKTMAF